MNHLPPGLLAGLSLVLLEAIDDLEHNCDLIGRQPTAYDVRWTLERAGADRAVCDAICPERGQ